MRNAGVGVVAGDRRCLMENVPSPVDPEVAAATFRRHLDDFFATGRGREPGWELVEPDELEAIVRVPATRPDGTKDHYFARLGADYYDLWPPSLALVRNVDGSWQQAAAGTRWWPHVPNIGEPGLSFALHASYRYPDGGERQLICYSHTLEYYLSNHNPTEEERWQQGVHTLAATLGRLALMLSPRFYLGPSGDRDS